MTPFTIAVPGGTLTGERRGGTGMPLIFAHGFGGSRRDWDDVIAAFPPDVPIVTYDQRGFGDSFAEAGRAFSHVEDLLVLLDALQIARADLCGVSLGGATVLGAALLAPRRVRRLVLVSPMLAGWSWSEPWVEQWKAIGRAARSGEITQARALWFDHPLFATLRASPQAAALRQSIARFAGQQWVRDDQRVEPPMAERLHAIAAPTLLLTGGLDLPDFRLMADRIAAAIPHVQRIDDPAAGHLLTLERPGEIAAAMATFLLP